MNSKPYMQESVQTATVETTSNVKPTQSPQENKKKSFNSVTSLKKLAIKNSVWSIFGFGMMQVMRLGGNVIVASLLYPEALGTMAIVAAVLMGIAMFSDIGLRPSIVQNKRGEEPLFLQTAWTLQVIRGFLLALIAAALAWPISWLNNNPDLIPLLSVAGLTSILYGFCSTWLLVYSRRLQLSKLVILEIVAAFVGTVTMITWAYISPSIWALVSSAFASEIVKLVASHTVLRGEVPMRFRWDRESARELIRFGRWIFFSTGLGFFLARLDVFVLGKVAGEATLGIYGVAKNFSRTPIDALMRLSEMVLFPVYSRLQEQDRSSLRAKTFKARGALLLLFLPPLWILTLWGDVFVSLLYDERYQQAGWMLQVLAGGATGSVILVTIRPILLAVGDSFRNLLNTIARFISLILAMSIGYYFGGFTGLVIGVAIADLFSYPILVFLIYRYGVWLPWLDALAFGSSLVVIGMALALA